MENMEVMNHDSYLKGIYDPAEEARHGHKSYADPHPTPLHCELYCEMPMSSHSSGEIREGFPEKVAFELTAGPQKKSRICTVDRGKDRPGAIRLQN